MTGDDPRDIARCPRKRSLMSLGWILLIAAAYVVLMRWALPALGFPT